MAAQRPPFERGTGFLLSRLGTLAERTWSSLLAEHGLTPTQYVVLVVLSGQAAVGQGQLARLAGIDGRNLVAVLDALEHGSLVARAVDPDDARRRELRLTARGEALVKALARDAAAGRDEFLRGLDDDERRQLNALLQRVYAAHTSA
jgi:DNA-binding MarR family transcriptional regulator